jgi:hypothetical protein
VNNQNLTPWPKGVSGSPNGRPTGTRQAFSAGFLKHVAEVWQAESRGTRNQPATFFAVYSRSMRDTLNYGIIEPSSGGACNALTGAGGGL